MGDIWPKKKDHTVLVYKLFVCVGYRDRSSIHPRRVLPLFRMLMFPPLICFPPLVIFWLIFFLFCFLKTDRTPSVWVSTKDTLVTFFENGLLLFYIRVVCCWSRV